MDRRNFLKYVGSAAATLASSGCTHLSASDVGPETKTSKGKPNVLLFCVDDLRPELGCYGNHIIQSPNIDRIAKRGVVFTHAYCQQAVCSPSRSSLLTGTRPDTTKVWDLNTHFRKALPDVVTLPQLFKNSGYFVQGMGKVYHHGFDDPASWSVPWTSPNQPHSAGKQTLDPDLAAKKRRLRKESRKKADRGPAFLAADQPDNALHDGQLGDMAIEALRQIKQRPEPFFLAVGFIKPHLPFVSPKKYWDIYDASNIPLAPNPFLPKDAPPFALANSGELHSYEGVPEGEHLPDEYARQLKHGYFAAVSYMDAQVGRVLDELEKQGLMDNTIIVLFGDHGWKLGEHDRWCKHSNVENDTNAPLLISAPGMARADVSTDGLVEFVDIYPTLAELAELPMPSHLEGSSAVRLMRNPARKWKKAAFSQYPRKLDDRQIMGYSMRTERYRFTRWVDRDDHSKVRAVELYDHINDPQENVNIAEVPENKELVEVLTRQWFAGWKKAKP